MEVSGLTALELERQVCDALPALARDSAAQLALAISRLVAELRPERIYLFGSQARGDARPDSDVDLLVVVPRTDEPAHRLAQAAYRAMGLRTLAMDVLVLPAEEFERRSRAPSSLPATVLREGRLLYAA